MLGSKGQTEVDYKSSVGSVAWTRLNQPSSERSRSRFTAWTRTPRGGVTILIAATLLARMLFADSLGLGIDESYVAAAGRTLHLGYFDHPPIVWWLTWAAEQAAGPGNGFAIRLPFMLLFSLSTWLMFRLASALFDERAGLWTAAALNAAPVFGIAAGTWVLPDGPLIAALLGAAVCLVHALPGGRGAWGWWLGTGFCFGLAALSKYTVAPVGLGAGLYLLTNVRARLWLKRPHPYVAALLTCAMFSPVIVWNAQNGWVSLLFQGGRANAGRWRPFGPISTLAGEALFFLPWIWLPLAVCVVRALRRGRTDEKGWLLVCLSMPSILLFEIVSLRAHVLFHWAAPATMLTLPLLGNAIAQMRRNSRLIRVGLVATAAFVTSGALFVGSEVRFSWLPLVFEDVALGTDPDLDAVDWTSLRLELVRREQLHPGVVIAATRWLDAGKIDFALRGEAPVICLGNDPREYGLTSPASAYVGRDLLIVAPRETLQSINLRHGGSFDDLEALPPVMLLHAGRPAMLLPLFLGHRFHNERRITN